MIWALIVVALPLIFCILRLERCWRRSKVHDGNIEVVGDKMSKKKFEEEVKVEYKEVHKVLLHFKKSKEMWIFSMPF